MIGKITKIDELKTSRNGKYAYRRVHFKLPQRDGTYKWAKTDLCDSFRNWNKWKGVLTIGNTLGNLELRDDTTIDADIKPVIIMQEKEVELEPLPTTNSMF